MATPEEIPGLQDKWSKDKHLVFQAQMVSIRQCSLGQEARWTLPPWGVGPPLMTVLSLQAPGKEAQLLVGGSWFSCERLCWLGLQAVGSSLESPAFPHRSQTGNGSGGDFLWETPLKHHSFVCTEAFWKCIPCFSPLMALAQPSTQGGAGARTKVAASLPMRVGQASEA